MGITLQVEYLQHGPSLTMSFREDVRTSVHVPAGCGHLMCSTKFITHKNDIIMCPTLYRARSCRPVALWDSIMRLQYDHSISMASYKFYGTYMYIAMEI